MKRDRIYFILSLLSLTMLSCRPQGDDLLSYGQNDVQAFYKTGESYEAQFEAFWLAMNQNYCIWDYEEEMGLDWDRVYKDYLPKFRALDDTTRQIPVSDEELRSLYSSIIDSLHDGHLGISITNPATKKNLVFSPSDTRNLRERGQEVIFTKNYPTDLHYYQNAGTWKMLAYDHTGLNEINSEHILRTCQTVSQKAASFLSSMESLKDQGNAAVDSSYNTVYEMKNLADNMIFWINSGKSGTGLAADFNLFCDYYGLTGFMVGVKLTPLDKELFDINTLKYIRSAVFPGNIAYLRISDFALSSFLNSAEASKDSSSLYFSYQEAVKRVWHHWFDTVQVMSQNNQLGGIIIDLRNNGGGRTDDYKYVLGALLPSGTFASHTVRAKNGLGRYDFAPKIPFSFLTYPDKHAVIDRQPVVVLCNVNSVSMAEITSWGVKVMPGKNGKLIGTRTWGGLSCLSTDPADYSATYSGAFGVSGVTSIYAYNPKFVSMFGEDEKILEGIGITPDIEVALDTTAYLATGRDNQLERALQYITSGN